MKMARLSALRTGHLYPPRDTFGSHLCWPGRSGDWIPVAARFSAPVQTGSEAHLASYTMGTGSYTGVKRPGPGVDHPPHPSSAEFEGRVYLYFYSPSGPLWPVLVWILPLPLLISVRGWVQRHRRLEGLSLWNIPMTSSNPRPSGL